MFLEKFTDDLNARCARSRRYDDDFHDVGYQTERTPHGARKAQLSREAHDGGGRFSDLGTLLPEGNADTPQSGHIRLSGVITT